MKHIRTSPWLAGLLLLLLVPADRLSAQITAPLDVMAGSPIHDQNRQVLAGRHPHAAAFGYAPQAGALVQILDVGANGVADVPDAAGHPGGDDRLLAETAIGAGMAPNLERSGRFAVSIPWSGPAGTRVVARVFNAPTLAAATHYGQSAGFVPRKSTVFDVSTYGLSRTSLAKGVDPRLVDSDQDGQSDYQELIANTDPGQASDTWAAVSSRFDPDGALVHTFAGRAGRAYRLYRSTNELDGVLSWQVISVTDLQVADQPLALRDVQPVDAPVVVYRLEAEMP